MIAVGNLGALPRQQRGRSTTLLRADGTSTPQLVTGSASFPLSMTAVVVVTCAEMRTAHYILDGKDTGSWKTGQPTFLQMLWCRIAPKLLIREKCVNIEATFVLPFSAAAGHRGIWVGVHADSLESFTTVSYRAQCRIEESRISTL